MGIAALLVLLGLLAATVTDPGSGTGTNLHAVDDAASLVIGAHHAKPLPTSGLARLSVVLLAVAAVARLLPQSPPRASVHRRRRADRVRAPRAVTLAVRALRAPPALLPA